MESVTPVRNSKFPSESNEASNRINPRNRNIKPIPDSPTPISDHQQHPNAKLNAINTVALSLIHPALY